MVPRSARHRFTAARLAPDEAAGRAGHRGAHPGGDPQHPRRHPHAELQRRPRPRSASADHLRGRGGGRRPGHLVGGRRPDRRRAQRLLLPALLQPWGRQHRPPRVPGALMALTLGLSDAGLQVPRLAEYLTEIRDTYRANTGLDVDWDSDLVLGQFSAIMAQLLDQQAEGLQAVYDAFDLNGSSGVQLSNIARLVGVTR